MGALQTLGILRRVRFRVETLFQVKKKILLCTGWVISETKDEMAIALELSVKSYLPRTYNLVLVSRKIRRLELGRLELRKFAARNLRLGDGYRSENSCATSTVV